MNDHQFDDDVVKAVYDACVAAGIDYMEFGYKASKRIFAKRRVRRRGSSATRTTSAASSATTRRR